jgi:hypothetical protein
VRCRDSALPGSSDTVLDPEPTAEPSPAKGVAGGLTAVATRLGQVPWYALRPEHGLAFERRRLAIWLAAFAVFAAATTIFSGGGADGTWAAWATGGYALAALLALRSRNVAVPLLTALGVALLAPTAWLALRAPATADVTVVTRSAVLLLRTGSPYLPAGKLATWQSYNPYLPAMALFGLPGAAGLPGLLGDPRPWLIAVSAVLFGASFWLISPHRVSGCRACRSMAAWCAVFAVASPVLALSLAVGITDPPVIGLICFGLACVARYRDTRSARLLVLAGLAIGVACAMKATAWPALAVIAAMLVTRDGVRVAARFTVAAGATVAGLIVVMAPELLTTPGALLQNIVLYPLGMTAQKTPAASPMPGHVLADTGHAGHLAAIGLLAAAGLAVAVSLFVRPPADVAAGTRRLAIGLALLFALAPATRFGYFFYPLALLGWSAMTSRVRPPAEHDHTGPQPAVPGPRVDTVEPTVRTAGRRETVRMALQYLLPERVTPAWIRHRRKAGDDPMTP